VFSVETPGAAFFLTPDSVSLPRDRCLTTESHGFQQFTQTAPREKTVQSLGTFCAPFYFNTGGNMADPNGRGGMIGFLSPGASCRDELLLDIRFPQTASGHPFLQFLLFL